MSTELMILLKQRCESQMTVAGAIQCRISNVHHEKALFILKKVLFKKSVFFVFSLFPPLTETCSFFTLFTTFYWF